MTTVVITGGARGIGRELARIYAAQGTRVIVGVRRTGAGAPGIEALPLDVADSGSVAEFARRIADQPVDILINNAGVIGPLQSAVEPMDFPAFEATLAVNTLGPLRVTQALLGNLRRAASAKVAIISSQMGSMRHPGADSIAYRASKAAVNKIAQGLATDLKREGIVVAAIHPGWVRTDMGGPSADIDVAESARGVKRVVDALDVTATGRFWNYDGSERPW